MVLKLPHDHVCERPPLQTPIFVPSISEYNPITLTATVHRSAVSANTSYGSGSCTLTKRAHCQRLNRWGSGALITWCDPFHIPLGHHSNGTRNLTRSTRPSYKSKQSARELLAEWTINTTRFLYSCSHSRVEHSIGLQTVIRSRRIFQRACGTVWQR